MSYSMLESDGLKFVETSDAKDKSNIVDLFKTIDDIDETIDYIQELNILALSFELMCIDKNAKDILRALSILIRHIYKHSVSGDKTTEQMMDDFKDIFMEIINNPVYSMLRDISEKKE